MCKAGQFTTRSLYYKNSDSEYMILREKKNGNYKFVVY